MQCCAFSVYVHLRIAFECNVKLLPARRARACADRAAGEGGQFLLRRLATGHGQRAHKRQSKSNHFLH